MHDLILADAQDQKARKRNRLAVARCATSPLTDDDLWIGSGKQELVFETLLDVDDAGAALVALIELMLDEGTRKRDFVDALGGTDLLTTHAMDQVRARFRKALASLIARAQKQGAIRADVQATDITALVKGLFGANAKSRARLLKIFVAGLRP